MIVRQMIHVVHDQEADSGVMNGFLIFRAEMIAIKDQPTRVLSGRFHCYCAVTRERVCPRSEWSGYAFSKK